MNNTNFDVAFLLLSRKTSKRFSQFLNWYELLFDAGFRAVMATDSSELHQLSERFRIVIVDGNEELDDFDPLQVTRTLRTQYGTNQCIVYVSDETPEAFERGRSAGADICIQGDVQGLTLCETLKRLAYGHAQALLLDGFVPAPMLKDAQEGQHLFGDRRMATLDTSHASDRCHALAAHRVRARQRKGRPQLLRRGLSH